MFTRYRTKKYSRFDFIDAADLTITDVLVLQPKERLSAGEFYDDLLHEIPALPRIMSHITYLCEMVSSYHQSQYYDLNDQPKTGTENKITRLVLDEFSFYPQKTPLTTQEFLRVMAHIESLGMTMPANIHVVFSSFPVLNFNNEFYNLVVYLQSGKIPSISQFSKAVFAGSDPKYSLEGTALIYRDSPDISCPNTILLSDSEHFATSPGGIIQCKTLGGAHFYCAIEICLELERRVGKNALSAAITTTIANEQSLSLEGTELVPELMPLLLSHVVTSNVIMLRPGGGMGKTTQADRSIISFMQNHPSLFYKGEQLIPQGDELAIMNPAFGNSLRVIIKEPHRPSLLPEELRLAVLEHQSFFSKPGAIIRHDRALALDRQADLEQAKSFVALVKKILVLQEPWQELQKKLQAIFSQAHGALHTIASIELFLSTIYDLGHCELNQALKEFFSLSPLFPLIYNADTAELARYLESHPDCLTEMNDKQETVLHAVAKTNESEKIKLIISKLKPNLFKTLLEQADIFEKTALFTAAQMGCFNAVKLLIEHGANIEASIFEGYHLTAKEAAAENGFIHVASLLMQTRERQALICC